MRAGWLAIALSLLAAGAAAQYKWIDAGGRVGFGDKPPAGAHDIEPLDGVQSGTRPQAQAGLPYELRVTMQKYPVTLYTTGDCPGCTAGRDLLRLRGVPYAERTLASAGDAQALKKVAGSDRLPALQVGSRSLTGYNSAEWTEALDLAGYPAQSRLPADWAWPAAQPMTPPAPAPATPAPASPAGGVSQ